MIAETLHPHEPNLGTWSSTPCAPSSYASLTRGALPKVVGVGWWLSRLHRVRLEFDWWR